MRFVTFQADAAPCPGLLLDDGDILDLPAALAAAGEAGLIAPDWRGPAEPVPESLIDYVALGPRFLGAAAALVANRDHGALQVMRVAGGQAKLRAPIVRPRKNVFCVGRNYAEHAAESDRARNTDEGLPKHPVFFTKPPTAVVGPDAQVRVDRSVSEQMDYEVELGVIIGQAGRDIPASRAHEHIFGYTIINDVTARDLQRRHGGQFFKGKGLDTSCPMGPHIVTADALADVGDLAIRLWVNGELRQDARTSAMIFPVPVLIESLSEGMTLEPGDVLASGTPSGVGYAMDPPRFLQHGDTMRCEIEGIGVLTNAIVDQTPKSRRTNSAPAGG